MKILLDHNLPTALRLHLSEHEVSTAFYLGWGDLSNGTLLAAAEGYGFQVMITGDKSIVHQQNHAGRKIALLALSTNDWSVIKRDIDSIRQALLRIGIGSYEEVALAP